MRIASVCIAFILFVIIGSGGILYTFNQTRIYQASGMLEIVDPRPVPALQLEDLIDETLLTESDPAPTADPNHPERELEATARASEDMETQVQILLSDAILRRVEQRLQAEERERFMAPYLAVTQLSAPLTPSEILHRNRHSQRLRHSRMIRVSYQHPDPLIAAHVANLFMEEYINHQLNQEIDGYMKMVEDLRIRIDQLKDQITELATSATVLSESQKEQLEILQEQRARLFKAMNEAKIRVNMANPEARIVDKAVPPPADAPIKPKVIQNLATTFGIALATSLFCILLGCLLHAKTIKA